MSEKSRFIQISGQRQKPQIEREFGFVCSNESAISLDANTRHRLAIDATLKLRNADTFR